MLTKMWTRFAPARLAVVFLGHRLAGAGVQQDRVETFVVEAEDPAAALRAELDARGLAPRTVALGLARASVTVKPIELPPIAGELADMVRFELERHLPFPADDAPFAFLPLPAAGEGEPGAAGAARGLIAAPDRRGLVRAPRGQRVVWAHVCGDAAELLLVQDGGLVLSRSVPLADDGALAAEVTRSFGPARWRGCDAVWVSGAGGPSGAALGALGAPVSAPPRTARAARRPAARGARPRDRADRARRARGPGGPRRPRAQAPAPGDRGGDRGDGRPAAPDPPGPDRPPPRRRVAHHARPRPQGHRAGRPGGGGEPPHPAARARPALRARRVRLPGHPRARPRGGPGPRPAGGPRRGRRAARG